MIVAKAIRSGIQELTVCRFSSSSPLSKQVSVGAADTLKVILTTTDDKSPKRPHQAFLTLHDPKTGLEESFPFNIKENGKGKVEVVRLPLQEQ